MLVWFDTEATFGGGALFGSVGVLRQGSWLMCLGMAVGCLAGCGGADDGFAYQPVSGVVTVDGEPVAGLTVSFAPQTAALESGRPSVATTDEEGRYVAKTLDGVVGAAEFGAEAKSFVLGPQGAAGVGGGELQRG